jgi:transposase
MSIDTNLYKLIRRLHLVDGLGQREIARRLNVSRCTIKKYCAGAIVPDAKKNPLDESKDNAEKTILTLRKKLEQEILKIIEENKNAPLKQGLNAKIIWQMLMKMGYEIGESTIRKYIQEMRIENPAAFIPLEFEPGEAMEFDWGDVHAIIDSMKTRVSVFCSALPYSYGIHCSVFPDKTSVSFFTGHINAFGFFEGVPRRCIYDNLKSAVLEGSGKDAVKQEKFKKLEAHYAFEGVFCNAASGWEKGGVENLVSTIRKIAFTPMPKVKDYAELQEHVTQKCFEYCESHKIKGRERSIKDMLSEERKYLLPLPVSPMDASEEIKALVHPDLTVRLSNVKYSVPTSLVGLYVALKITPFHIKVYHGGKLVWTHNKAINPTNHQYIPEHYLDILERRPRAINNALPLKKGVMPVELKEFMRLCCARDKNYQLINILLLGRKVDRDTLLWAVKQANSSGTPSYNLVCFYLDIGSSDPSGLSTDIKVNDVDLDQYDKYL